MYPYIITSGFPLIMKPICWYYEVNNDLVLSNTLLAVSLDIIENIFVMLPFFYFMIAYYRIPKPSKKSLAVFLFFKHSHLRT